MTEQHITMLAIRYLAQICETFSAELQAGRIANVISATHYISWGAKHIQQIAQNNYENQEQQKRLWYIRDAMDWLIILRKNQDEILSRSDLQVPTESDIRLVRMTAMTCNTN